MRLDLHPQPLTKAAFEPFGDVIETHDSDYFMINDGNTRRFHRLAEVDTGPSDGRAIINIFKSGVYAYPMAVRMLEHHPHGSQAFMPLHGQPYLVVVAPRADQPDPGAIQAFIARGDQGVNYHRATWHHPVLALTDQDEFLVVDRGGDRPNCIEHHFADDLTIVLHPPSGT